MNPSVEAWIVIEKLAALCATPNVNEDVLLAANEQIAELLKNVITPNLAKLKAQGSGLII